MRRLEVCALFGYPLTQTVSPFVYNAAFQKLNLDIVFLALEARAIDFAVDVIRNFNFRGASITKPHKVSVMKYLDKIDSIAKKIEAVNMVVNKNSELIGYNTDYLGAINAIKQKMKIRHKRITLVGGGGGARAIAFGLKKEKCEVSVLNRTIEKAGKIAQKFDFDFGDLSKLAELEGDILINATSVGMFPKSDESLFPKNVLQKYDIVFDTVYNPLKTKLIKDAEKVGCKTVLGVEMFLEQARIAFRYWTGKRAPRKIMSIVAYKMLSNFK